LFLAVGFGPSVFGLGIEDQNIDKLLTTGNEYESNELMDLYFANTAQLKKVTIQFGMRHWPLVFGLWPSPTAKTNYQDQRPRLRPNRQSKI
jgi:hypothetical protein